MYVNIVIYSNKLLLFAWSTLQKEKKKNIRNIHSIVSTLSNVVQINAHIRQRWFDVVQHCKFQCWRTQYCFNVDLTLSDVATSYQIKNNVEATSKCLSGWLDWVSNTFHSFINSFEILLKLWSDLSFQSVFSLRRFDIIVVRIVLRTFS